MSIYSHQWLLVLPLPRGRLIHKHTGYRVDTQHKQERYTINSATSIPLLNQNIQCYVVNLQQNSSYGHSTLIFSFLKNFQCNVLFITSYLHRSQSATSYSFLYKYYATSFWNHRHCKDCNACLIKWWLRITWYKRSKCYYQCWQYDFRFQ